ncbi:hypothetical protein N7495_002304 [Penicillium taxi]|uniref:uncharacterized protein n=1 Tax=Penicillium taxi TaxID=168475 RepID=UPI0025457711|nr:uncharacterized protein N7495_002304 [Penicillium taxi]KAJ5901776.1 hypothetical protein N7495_002304 [Penicillium taxi]
MDIPIAENVLGTLGAVSYQFKPTKILSTNDFKLLDGLQGSMMLLWASAGVPLGVYNIVENFNVALRIQPQILTVLSLITWAQCLHYGKRYSVSKCIAVIVPMILLFGGVEAGLIFALRAAKRRHLEWPVILMAVLSACLLAGGVLTHYWDIYIHRTVRGISFFFVGIDAAGDLFSLISLLFGPSIDTLSVLGMVIYGTELTLWLGIFTCGAIFNLVPWLKTRSKKSETPQEPITLHQMPSSTSVFRTISGSEVAERRGWPRGES